MAPQKKKKSPLPIQEHKVQPDKLTFPQALNFVIDGKKITKLEWGNDLTYGVLQDGKLMICIDGKMHQWIISEGDLIGIDWVVIPDQKYN